MSKQIIEYKVCPTCGTEFLPNRPNRKFCSFTCQRKSFYHPLTKIKNPIGVIEGIIISFTVHVEGNDKGKHTRDKILWFVVQGNGKIGNVDLKVLRERNFRVSDILLHNGYVIQDPKAFDREFKKLIKILV